MRLSITPGDAGHRTPFICRRATVTLDGVVQEGCVITADEERGYVQRYRFNRVKGFSHVGKAKLATERVYGTVVITWEAGWEGGVAPANVEDPSIVVP